MRVLFIGDVVGSMGREMITEYLPRLKKKYRPQVTIVNGENAASGRGITEKIYKKFLQDGVDVVTMGNHTWDNRGIFEFVNEAKKDGSAGKFSGRDAWTRDGLCQSESDRIGSNQHASSFFHGGLG